VSAVADLEIAQTAGSEEKMQRVLEEMKAENVDRAAERCSDEEPVLHAISKRIRPRTTPSSNDAGTGLMDCLEEHSLYAQREFATESKGDDIKSGAIDNQRSGHNEDGLVGGELSLTSCSSNSRRKGGLEEKRLRRHMHTSLSTTDTSTVRPSQPYVEEQTTEWCSMQVMNNWGGGSCVLDIDRSVKRGVDRFREVVQVCGDLDCPNI
jgi:hypothetical protein